MKNKPISIIIIPDTKKIRSINIPCWLPKLLLVVVVSIILFVTITLRNISSSYVSLQHDHNNNLQQLEALENDNEIKNNEINNLKSQTEKVNKKLKEIEKLQRKLENMAGVKSTSRSNFERNFPISNINDEKDIELLNNTLDEKEEELIVFIDDIEKRFEYLKSVPNLKPVNGNLSSNFGYRNNPFRKRRKEFHQGIDISNSYGTEIKAAANGVVVFSGWKGGYGKTVIIDHGNSYKTLYAHNSEIKFRVGDKVEKGQVITKMGSTGRSTGCHLHFEIHKNGKPINPLEILE